MDVTMHKDKQGNYNVDIRGVGPLITGVQTERVSVRRTAADDEGKPDAYSEPYMCGDDIDELRLLLQRLEKALGEPVLHEKDFV
jgi:hypothetical protein